MQQLVYRMKNRLSVLNRRWALWWEVHEEDVEQFIFQVALVTIVFGILAAAGRIVAGL